MRQKGTMLRLQLRWQFATVLPTAYCTQFLQSNWYDYFQISDLHSIVDTQRRLTSLTMAFIVVNPFTTKSKNTTARLCKAPSVGYTSKRYHPRMGIRAVESYDGSFTLTEEVRNALDGMLLSARLSDYVANQARRESAEYMGILFQPLPYSKATPHGKFASCSQRLD